MKTIEYLIDKKQKTLDKILAQNDIYDNGDYEKKCIKAYTEILETNNYEDMALIWAEHIGVYSYQVKGNILEYISYYGSEGFYKVRHNLDTMEETRKHQASTKKEYNYFCG